MAEKIYSESHNGNRLEKIKKDKQIKEEDYEEIKKFKQHLEARGLTDNRVNKYLNILHKISKWKPGKPFEELDKEDVETIVSEIEKTNFAESTKCDYRTLFKRFFQWIRDMEEQYPKEVSWISTTVSKEKRKEPEDLLTEEDIKELIKNTNIRDKAFIITLYETGARIGEFLGLKKKHIKFLGEGVEIRITEGKTGPRTLPILRDCEPYLSNWIENHPGDSRDDYIWTKIDTNERVSYGYANKLLKKAKKRAEIEKPVNPHHFRHSRATFMARRLTEAEMSQYFGWVQGSRMPGRYVHMAGRDLTRSLKEKVYDIPINKEEKTEDELKPINCSRCGLRNSPAATRCQRCGNLLEESGEQSQLKEMIKGVVQEEMNKE